MLFNHKNIRRDPYEKSVYAPEKPIRLDEARLEAWARAHGQRRESLTPRALRSAVSDLPDDAATARPEAMRRGAVARLIRRFLGKPHDAPLHGQMRDEKPRVPYVWTVDAEPAIPDADADAGTVTGDGKRLKPEYGGGGAG